MQIYKEPAFLKALGEKNYRKPQRIQGEFHKKNCAGKYFL